MATKQQLVDLLNQDITLLDEKISEVIVIKNSLAISDPERGTLSDILYYLMDSRTDLYIEIAHLSLKSAQLAKALQKLTDASTDLSAEAAKMKDATTVINNANAVIGVATKILSIAKKG